MRFFTTALVALATLTTAVFASEENPITFPSAGDIVVTGQATTIKWTPTTSDKSISLYLRKGESKALDNIGPICDNCPNSGTYTWTPPKTLVAGKDYSIEIRFQSGTNYSPQFTIDSTVTATSSAPKKTATTTTEASSTTEATTESTTTAHTSTTLAPKTEYVNNTVTVTMSGSTTTSRPRTTTTAATTTASGAPDPHNAAGLEKAVSGGLAVVAVAAWALIL